MIEFKVANFSNWNLYVDVIVKEYPKDILKVKSYSNKVKIKREIFEVIDEVNLSKCSDRTNYPKYSNEVSITCDNSLRLVTNNTYKKWWLYKVVVDVEFLDNKDRENFVVEDYLAWTFRVINSNFNTESSLVRQDTKNKSWSWKHLEYRTDVVMAKNRYVWWNTSKLIYYVRAEFVWFYTQPPVTGYFMYNPLIRANSEFNIIEVK